MSNMPKEEKGDWIVTLKLYNTVILHSVVTGTGQYALPAPTVADNTNAITKLGPIEMIVQKNHQTLEPAPQNL